MPLYDMRCPEHGTQVRFLKRPARVQCSREGCRRRVRWVPSFARVEGEGWFKPGHDPGLGRHIESPQHRRQVMKEVGAVESASTAPVAKRGVLYSFGAFLLALLLSPASFAADGDIVTGRNVTRSTLYLLCDTKTANDASCPDAPGLQIVNPCDTYIFSIDEDDGCTAFSVAIEHTAASGGDVHNVCTLSFGGTTSCVVYGPLSQYVNANISGEADCTNLDVTFECIYDEE